MKSKNRNTNLKSLSNSLNKNTLPRRKQYCRVLEWKPQFSYCQVIVLAMDLISTQVEEDSGRERMA